MPNFNFLSIQEVEESVIKEISIIFISKYSVLIAESSKMQRRVWISDVLRTWNQS